MAKHDPYLSLPPFRDDGTVNVIVETPAGSRAKIKYEIESRIFMVSKFLPEGFVFPFDFGFVPGTLAEDGDPIDVMLVAETGTATGCLVPARLLGALVAEENGKKGKPVRNDRILAVPLVSREYAELTSLTHLPEALRDQIRYFLTSYGALDGKTLTVTDTHGPEKAEKLVREAMDNKP